MVQTIADQAAYPQKITLPHFFLAILLAVSASILVTNIVFDTVEERYQNQLGEVGQLS
jgi:Na+/glutamate symporter